jgi:hypothetical protein
MGLLERLRALLGQEAKDVKESVDRLAADLEAEVDEKQRRLDATPTEALDLTLGDIEESDAAFDALKDEIQRRQPPAG